MKKLILFTLVAIVLMECTQQPVKSFGKQVVTVHAGDTLWSVASKYSGDIYILEYLENLKALKENQEVLQPNRLLQAGDKIVVLRAKGAGE